jgi:hypothetical protein
VIRMKALLVNSVRVVAAVASIASPGVMIVLVPNLVSDPHGHFLSPAEEPFRWILAVLVCVGLASYIFTLFDRIKAPVGPAFRQRRESSPMADLMWEFVIVVPGCVALYGIRSGSIMVEEVAAVLWIGYQAAWFARYMLVLRDVGGPAKPYVAT